MNGPHMGLGAARYKQPIHLTSTKPYITRAARTQRVNVQVRKETAAWGGGEQSWGQKAY